MPWDLTVSNDMGEEGNLWHVGLYAIRKNLTRGWIPKYNGK